MNHSSGFLDTPPKIVRTYNKKLEHDGYFIIDKENFGQLMWVNKKHLKFANDIPSHRDDVVLDNTP